MSDNYNRFIPNSFQVPNAIVDDFLSLLSCNASKCYLFICRKTRGWNKSQDSISKSQFMAALSIKDERTIDKAIKELIRLDLICIKRVVGMTNTYVLTEYPTPPAKNEGGTKNVGTKNVGGTPHKKCRSQNTKIKTKEEEEEEEFSQDFLLDNFEEFYNWLPKPMKIQNEAMLKNRIRNNIQKRDKKTIDNFRLFCDIKDKEKNKIINSDIDIEQLVNQLAMMLSSMDVEEIEEFEQSSEFKNYPVVIKQFAENKGGLKNCRYEIIDFTSFVIEEVKGGVI